MIDLVGFSEGLAVIGAQLVRAVTAETMKAYWVALRDETEPGEWARFCAVAVKRRGWEGLPSVVVVMDALQEFRGAPSIIAEAVAAYERVIEAGVYTAEAGRTWTYRAVREACGIAAADAFLEAAGHNAFATTWDEAARRERFLGAYTQVARLDPAARLLPAGPDAKALPPGPDEQPTREEARQIVERLRETLVPDVPAPGPKYLVITDERLAELERQKAAILAGEPDAVTVDEAVKSPA